MQRLNFDDDENLAGNPFTTPGRPPRPPERTSPLPGQPNSARAAQEQSRQPKTKDEPDLKQIHKGAEMSRQRIESSMDAPFLGVVDRDKLFFRVMRVAGYGILTYDAYFSYEALSVATGNRNASIALSIGIFFLNYGVINSLFKKNFVRLFKLDFNNDKVIQAQEWVEWVTALGVLIIATLGFFFDWWTNFLGFDYLSLQILGLPSWATGGILAFFLMIVGHPLVYISDENLKQLAHETPDAKAQAAEVKLKNTAATAMVREGNQEAHDAGRELGRKLGAKVATRINWER